MIYLADHHAEVRRSLGHLLSAAGLKSHAFDTAQDLLAACTHAKPRCVITELRLPDLGVVELIRRLRDAGVLAPVIVVTSHGDAGSAVRALRGGAGRLFHVSARQAGPGGSRAIGPPRGGMSAAAPGRPDRVAPAARFPERAGAAGARRPVAGTDQQADCPNVAGLSQKTVENCRARLTAKMKADSIAELVCLALAAGVGSPKHQEFFNARDAKFGPLCAHLCPHLLVQRRHPPTPPTSPRVNPIAGATGRFVPTPGFSSGLAWLWLCEQFTLT